MAPHSPLIFTVSGTEAQPPQCCSLNSLFPARMMEGPCFGQPPTKERRACRARPNCCSTATLGSQVAMPEAWRPGHGVGKALGLLQHILTRTVDTASEEILRDTSTSREQAEKEELQLRRKRSEDRERTKQENKLLFQTQRKQRELLVGTSDMLHSRPH